MGLLRKYFVMLMAISFLYGFADQDAIIPIKKFEEIQDLHLSEETLVLIDVDNTIFRSKTHYGSAEFFSQIIDDELEKHNYTKAQAVMKVYDIWIKSQEESETELVDNEIHKFMDRARASGATIIAFTARQPVVAEMTRTQLDKHEVYPDELPGFKFEETYKRQIFPDGEWCKKKQNIKSCESEIEKLYHDAGSMFYKGILFAHDLNKKSSVFKDFFVAYKEYLQRKNLPSPKRIVFVDDGMHHLVSLEAEAKKMGLGFQGFHIDSDFKYESLDVPLED